MPNENKTPRRLPLRETRKVADAFQQVIGICTTKQLRRLLRETTQPAVFESDLAPAIRRLARTELQRRDRRRRQLPLL